MSSKAKSKGNRWELEVCKFLGEHLGGNFQRVPNSGGFIGASNSFRKKTMSDTQVRAAKGDIIPPDEMSKLNLECKNYESISFNLILNGECKQLDSWIDQTEEPADVDDISFTIFKITRKGSWIVFRESISNLFTLDNMTYLRYCKDTVYYNLVDFESFILANIDQIKSASKSS